MEEERLNIGVRLRPSFDLPMDVETLTFLRKWYTDGLVNVRPETIAVFGSQGIVRVPPGLRVMFAQKDDPASGAEGQ